jgi:uncharacterized membrane protein YdjX (TVP38/TMEM64 family)
MLPIPVFNVGTGWALQRCYNDAILVLLIGTTAVATGLWIGSMLAFTLGRTVLRH